MSRHQSKFYLSADARDRLKRESDRTTYSMSVIVDMLVKANLPADDEPFIAAGPYSSTTEIAEALGIDPFPETQQPEQDAEDDDFKPDVY